MLRQGRGARDEMANQKRTEQCRPICRGELQQKKKCLNDEGLHTDEDTRISMWNDGGGLKY